MSGRVKKKASKPMRIRKGVRVKVRMRMCNFGGRHAGATVWEGTSCCGGGGCRLLVRHIVDSAGCVFLGPIGLSSCVAPALLAAHCLHTSWHTIASWLPSQGIKITDSESKRKAKLLLQREAAMKMDLDGAMTKSKKKGTKQPALKGIKGMKAKKEKKPKAGAAGGDTMQE